MTERSAFEEAIVNAIANSFFTSQPGYTDASGMTHFNQAPALQTAYAIFEARKEDIIAAVIDKLDMDDLATKIAAPLVRALVEQPSRYFRDTSQEQFRQQVREAVVEKVAKAQADAILAAADG